MELFILSIFVLSVFFFTIYVYMKSKNAPDKSEDWNENIIEIGFKWLSFLFLPIFFASVLVYISENGMYSSYYVIFMSLFVVTAIMFFLVAIIDIIVIMKTDFDRITDVA